MTKQELYLKTAFCCMACDGDIADEEVAMVKDMCVKDELFKGLDVEALINTWIGQINQDGKRFLHDYLQELKSVELDEKEQLRLLSIAIKTIEADNKIEYSEVKFFKKIRFSLSVDDEAILKEHPDKEDFLLPDINVADDPIWDADVQFNKISLDLKDLPKGAVN